MVGRQFRRAAVAMVFSMFSVANVLPARGDSGNALVETRPVSVLGPRDARLIRSVTHAVRDASHRLGSEECGRVFSDFSDTLGVSIAEKLRATGQDGRTYLGWLIFRNGSREASCDHAAGALATDPGSRFVVVCGARFTDIESADPGYAAGLIIHEELHSLGLGENPPSSAEITSRVLARCGR